MNRAALLFLLSLALLTRCGEGEADTPTRDAPSVTATVDPEPALEVFRLTRADDGNIVVSGVVSTDEARALLIAEVGRNWPGRALAGDLAVEASAPASWVSEAIALMPYAARVDGGGMLVRAEPGRAGGGEISITGRVPDESTLARLAADAAASVAPPFVVLTPLTVGLPQDSASVADSTAARPVAVAAEAGGATAADALREALAGASISFRPGTTAPDPSSSPVLDRLAVALVATPTVHVVIAAPGEGSESGSLERALARRRAGALVAALVDRGVDAGRLAVDDAETPPRVVTLRVSAPGG